VPPTPTPEPGEIFFDTFESSKGWIVNPLGTDTATTGQWERANPEGTSYGGRAYQLDTTVSGVYDLVTGPLAGSSVGSHDIDNGDTTVRSPDITLPSGEDITLSFSYYLAHHNNATTDDYLRVKVVGNTTTTVFEELGTPDAYDEAVWAEFSTSLNAFAGQTIYLLIEAADAGSSSLIEAAIDDVLIKSTGAPPPTPTPGPPTPTPTAAPPTPTPTPTPTGEPPTPTPVPPTPTPTPTSSGGW